MARSQVGRVQIDVDVHAMYAWVLLSVCGRTVLSLAGLEVVRRPNRHFLDRLSRTAATRLVRDPSLSSETQFTADRGPTFLLRAGGYRVR